MSIFRCGWDETGRRGPQDRWHRWSCRRPAYVGGLQLAGAAPFALTSTPASGYFLLIPAALGLVAWLAAVHLDRGDAASGLILASFLVVQAALWLAYATNSSPDLTYWPDPRATAPGNEALRWLGLILAGLTVPAAVAAVRRCRQLGLPVLLGGFRDVVLGFVVVVHLLQFYFWLLIAFPPLWLMMGAIAFLAVGLVALVKRFGSLLALTVLLAGEVALVVNWWRWKDAGYGEPPRWVQLFADANVAAGSLAVVGLLVVGSLLARERLRARRQLNDRRAEEHARVTRLNMRAAHARHSTSDL